MSAPVKNYGLSTSLGCTGLVYAGVVHRDKGLLVGATLLAMLYLLDRFILWIEQRAERFR